MMRGTRTYPTDASGPFPGPPVTFEDADDRRITIEPIGGAGAGVEGETTDASVVDALTEMYLQFDPEDRAQGIPPISEDGIRKWLEPIVANGINVVARVVDGDADAGGEGPDGESHGDDEFVGHATLVPDADDPEHVDDPGAIEWELAIFVLQDFQRAGIGTVLLETLLGHAADLGVERVWLTVERWNGPAIALYERVGFEVCGTETFDREMAIRLSAGDPEE